MENLFEESSANIWKTIVNDKKKDGVEFGDD